MFNGVIFRYAELETTVGNAKYLIHGEEKSMKSPSGGLGEKMQGQNLTLRNGHFQYERNKWKQNKEDLFKDNVYMLSLMRSLLIEWSCPDVTTVCPKIVWIPVKILWSPWNFREYLFLEIFNSDTQMSEPAKTDPTIKLCVLKFWKHLTQIYKWANQQKIDLTITILEIELESQILSNRTLHWALYYDFLTTFSMALTTVRLRKLSPRVVLAGFFKFVSLTLFWSFLGFSYWQSLRLKECLSTHPILVNPQFLQLL